MLTNLNGIPVKTIINTAFNICKGLTYNYNLTDFTEFKKLLEHHGLVNVEEPHWIKARRQAKPLLLTVRNEVPQFIEIPGENMWSRVYEYKEKSLMCKKCLQYGHSKNSCQDKQRCAKCGEENHIMEGCQRDAAKCYKVLQKGGRRW